MVYYGGTYNFVDLFQRLDYWGLTDALLPFLFVFVIVYAILQKIKIFGKEGAGEDDKAMRKFNAVIAFTVGMFVVVPHIMGTYPPGYDVVEIMKAFLPGISGVLIAALMMLVLIGMFGGGTNRAKSKMGGWIAIAAFVIVVYVFGAAAQWWGGWYWLTSFFGEDAIALIIMLLVFGVIVAYILGDSDDNKPGFFGSLRDESGKFFFKE